MSRFRVVQSTDSGQVKPFDVAVQWLSETEAKRSATYCVIVTDEERQSHTLTHDSYRLSGVVVLYAFSTNDVRAKIDLMIEDAISVLRTVFQASQDLVQKASVDSVSVSEASTGEGDLAQAVIRWTAVHQRLVMV